MLTTKPNVPQSAYRTERAWIALRQVFDALTNYEAISNRDLAPAALAGWWDIAAAVSEIIHGGEVDLAAIQRARRDRLVEAAHEAHLPQRQRRKPTEGQQPPIKKVV